VALFESLFFSWCGEQNEYKAIIQTNPAKTRKAREAFGKPSVKQDVLQREQLAAWCSEVRGIGNPAISAYLQILLLTGARPGEVLVMRWEDLNETWRSMAIRDKVEGERLIPLTAYVGQLVASLPRRNEWVFSSPSSESGRLTIPRSHHIDACKVAGLEGLTLHGLRRSFSSLTEWLETPAAVVAQVMGHKPSATAEKHFKVRPLDLLRVHHERIEAWILEQAGVAYVAGTEVGKRRAVV
jgi:integrase